MLKIENLEKTEKTENRIEKSGKPASIICMNIMCLRID